MSAKVLSRLFREEHGQGCQHCGVWTTGRSYGEKVSEFGFTGWRGPFCSVACYRAEYPEESAEVRA